MFLYESHFCSFITEIPREELEEYSDIDMLREIEKTLKSV